MAVTWDSGHKGPDLVLSDGDLTITHGAASNDWEQVFASTGYSSGKYYFEVEVVTGDNNYDVIGVGNRAESVETYTGDTANGWGYMANARFYNSGIVYPYGSPHYDDGDIIMVAVDLDDGKIWWGKNGSWLKLTASDTPDPATGTDSHYSNLTGTLYPAACIYSIADELKGRFLTTAFSYTPPTGFSAWDPGGGATICLEDLSLNVSAYFQELSDLGLFLAAEGDDLQDLKTRLQAADWDIHDIKTGLSAYYQGLNNMQARLAVRGYDVKDLPLLLAALARGLADLPVGLSAAALDLFDIKTSLQAVDGLVLRDLALLLSAADGTVLKDLAVRLSAIKETPAFVATVAQRLTSVITEVT